MKTFLFAISCSILALTANSQNSQEESNINIDEVFRESEFIFKGIKINYRDRYLDTANIINGSAKYYYSFLIKVDSVFKGNKQINRGDTIEIVQFVGYGYKAPNGKFLLSHSLWSISVPANGIYFCKSASFPSAIKKANNTFDVMPVANGISMNCTNNNKNKCSGKGFEKSFNTYQEINDFITKYNKISE
ncbi:MAG: hypothetical protein HYY40_08970 [Bacteroidetes bacterium]|nr:hypothetical protein [Bacteroidota bacterium]